MHYQIDRAEAKKKLRNIAEHLPNQRLGELLSELESENTYEVYGGDVEEKNRVLESRIITVQSLVDGSLCARNDICVVKIKKHTYVLNSALYWSMCSAKVYSPETKVVFSATAAEGVWLYKGLEEM